MGCLHGSISLLAQNEIVLQGVITDEKKQSIEFATVVVKETEEGTHSNKDGYFKVGIPANKFDRITLEVTYVNKVSVEKIIHSDNFSDYIMIEMKEKSLTLDEVQLAAVRKKKHSASSIVFDREAIDQSQAFSLADILMKLPGKTTEAPDLQTPITPKLRTVSQGINAMNNSFGIAIYVDGVRLNKDNDIQARSLSIRGMTNGGIASHKEGGHGYDVTYDGTDLRNIPLENVERIEVIQGVADARYGELTNGAILITTKAGRTPTNWTLNFNGGSSQITGSKGFQLKGKAGAINVSGGLTHSNKDPRDKVKSYTRLNTSLKWTVDLSQQLKNTLSLGFSTKLDDVKMDPDDDTEQRTYQKSRSVDISNRTAWRPKKGMIRDVDLNIAYSRGYQNSYTQWLLNGMPFGIADKDTTGVYEGFYVPGAYLATEHILGKPVSLQANLRLQSQVFYTGELQHRLSAGYSYSSSGNKGPGTLSDPHKPRWQGNNLNYRSERPVDRSKLLPFLSNHGFYLQDNITGYLRDHKYTANLGFRTDIQNGFLTYQPRLGVTYDLNDHWGLSFSYGTSTKAPSLATRYPVPSWIDIPVLQLYNGYAAESLFLVYTHKSVPDNSYLKPTKSTTAELGIKFQNQWSNGSVYFYQKKTAGGFNSLNYPSPIYVPEYDYVSDDDGIRYWPTGKERLFTESRSVATNGLYTEDKGIEVMFSTKKIQAIATSFSVSASYTHSDYDNRFDTIYKSVNQDISTKEKPALYAVYKPEKKQGSNLITTFSSTTHIPKIGFTATFSADVEWMAHIKRKPGDRYAIGYLDHDFNHVEIAENERYDPQYDYLKKPEESMNAIRQQHIVFPPIHVTLAKEIKEKIRIMLKAYNMFNIRPQYINPVTKEIEIFNAPVSLSAGIIFQL